MLQLDDLDFSYPNDLVALTAKARGTSRILHIPRSNEKAREINWSELSGLFSSGDVLVLNDSKVLWARLKIQKESGSDGEIFFLRKVGENWEVLSRALNLKVGKVIGLPGEVQAEVMKVGRIAELKILQKLSLPEYFQKYGQVPLPPYITTLRSQSEDEYLSLESVDRERYQNIWAKNWGSVAAPTAGLHFDEEYLSLLRAKGVHVAYVTLHVGAGTFLPIETKNIADFEIHQEFAQINEECCKAINEAKNDKKKIWACGTTVVRALESAALETAEDGRESGADRKLIPFEGETGIFIKPGYRFKIIDGLLTNFHQPRSTLLALAAAFGTPTPPTTRTEEVKTIHKLIKAYEFAIAEKFRLFSYGDLTVMV